MQQLLEARAYYLLTWRCCLVCPPPLPSQEQASVSRLVGQVDKANGACYAKLDRPPVPVPAELLAASGHTAADDDLDADLQERYIDSSGTSSSTQRQAAGRDNSKLLISAAKQQQQRQQLQGTERQQGGGDRQQQQHQQEMQQQQQQQQLGADVAAVAAAAGQSQIQEGSQVQGGLDTAEAAATVGSIGNVVERGLG